MAASPVEKVSVTVDVKRFLSRAEGYEADCLVVAQSLAQYGIVIIKDDRVEQSKSNKFLDMLEDYFDQPMAKKAKDIHPEIHYQLGATPSDVEKARADNCDFAGTLSEDNKPVTICPPGYDPKWRYFWRMGEPPKDTEYPSLNAEQTPPDNFPEWSSVMNEWGTLMLQGCDTVARMAAIGFGLPETTFTNMMQHAPHLLAPTGSDIGTLPVGTVLAGLHYDLNFLTIHGKSRYPGLSAWMRGGKKFHVHVAEGCLLLQAGKQLEWLTGGVVFAGYHEVVVTESAKERAAQFKAQNRPQWRVSSTLFSHIASDQVMKPIPLDAQWTPAPNAADKYPPTKAGKQVADELAAIKLAAPEQKDIEGAAARE